MLSFIFIYNSQNGGFFSLKTEKKNMVAFIFCNASFPFNLLHFYLMLLFFFLLYILIRWFMHTFLVHAYFKAINLCSLSSALKISPPKSTTCNSCLRNCLLWEIHHCHTTCPTVKLAKCLTGESIL